MKKKRLTRGGNISHFKRLLFIMKLTIFLIFSGLMTVSASIYSQSTRLSLELNNVSILDLFKQIESQSEFVFIYKNEVIDLNKRVNVKADALTVDQILNDTFKELGLKYEIIKKQIIVTGDHSLPSAKPEKVIQGEQQQPQKKQLKGKVTSANGEPIPGTTVVVKGTFDGITTDDIGNFSVDVPLDAKTLIFSFVGMKTQEIPIGKKTTFNVILEEETFAMDEIITVGYGTKKKRDVIGSVAQVKGDEVANPTYGNFVDALQGKATGVAISGSQIRIRGIGSISNGSDPLYVVDGVIMGDAFNLISSNDIESIDVQKDAAATSIFGSRASNGVIIITTKSGKGSKKDLFNIELNSGINQYTNDGYPLADSQEQLATMRLASLNTTNTAFDPSYPYASWNSKMMPLMVTDSLADATNVDWRKLTTRNRKVLNLVNYAGKYDDVTISGSKVIDNSNAYVSLNYRNNEGMQYGNSSKRIIGKLGFNYTPIKNINFSFVSSISYWKGLTGASYGGPGFSLPYLPAYDKSATGYWNPGFNPLANADKDLVDSYATGFTSFGNVGLELIVPWVKGLSFKGTAGWDYSSNHDSSWANALMSGGVRAKLGVESNWGQDYKSNNSKILLIGLANFNRTFGAHKIDFVAGTEKERGYGNASYMTGSNFPSVYHEIGTLTKESFNGASSSDFIGENIILAYFGRLSYAYKGKYMVEGSSRRDGYSKFAKEKRWGTFSSVGLGWMLSDEEFFKVSWLNMFKLRASIGQTGNSAINIANPSVNVYRIKADNNTYMNIPAEYLSNIGNPMAGWETSTKKDAGFDYGFFGNKINGSVAYFINDIDGLLLASPLPSSAGILGGNSIWQNIGSMQNKGYEFSINAVPINTNNFSWNVSFNYTNLSNKITKLNPEAEAKGTGIRSGNCITKVGLPISTYFVPEWAGVDPEKGIPLVKPIDTELFKETGETVFTGGDPVYLSEGNGVTHAYIQKGKSAMATFYGGFFNSFKYKNIDLGINFTYSGGNYVFDSNLNSQMIILTGWQQIIAGRLDNSWEKPGNVKKFPQITLNNKYYFDNNGETSVNQTNAWAQADSRMLIKGDYLKLKMLTLGYSLPSLFSKKIGIAGLRIYGSISNVWTLSYLKGDPEVTFGNNIDGLNANFTPIVRTCSLGLSAKF